VGTWPGAKRVPCSGAPLPGEVCVPGGAYWMGNPALSTSLPGGQADAQRLVVVAPFFVDATEVTVAQLRASGLATSGDPMTAAGSLPTDLEATCTYTTEAGDAEAFPVNCVSWDKGRAYCQAAGKDLPTEAQWEYVAGALRSLDFVWGRDDPTCTDAVFGPGGVGAYVGAISPCRPTEGLGGPLPAGSGARDVLELSTGKVFDLAGNLFEQARDVFNAQDEPCWGPGVFHDPSCETPGAFGGRAFRGGGWTSTQGELLAANRYFFGATLTSSQLGFRCARDAR
jgi:formylglycine-generating enzyme required for sulfatase activity